ncbi:hypothetical protein M0P98_08130 [bacterium]|nr:hypothetical protein [bacterium]
MDIKNLLELLNNASLDCERAIEKGFGPKLNMLTIKEQIDTAIKLVDTSGGSQDTPVVESVSGVEENKEESLMDKIEAELAKPSTEEDVTEASAKEEEPIDAKEALKDMSNGISLYSADSAENKSETPEDATPKESIKLNQETPKEENTEENKKLPLQQTNTVQPLKSSSSIPSMPKKEE